MKVSDHWVRSPLLNITRACQSCHPYAEAEIQARVDAIQDRTHALMRALGGRADRTCSTRSRPPRRPARPTTQLAPVARAAAQGAVAARLRRGRELDGLPRAAGGGAGPGRGDRLRAPGAARREDTGPCARDGTEIADRRRINAFSEPADPTHQRWENFSSRDAPSYVSLMNSTRRLRVTGEQTQRLLATESRHGSQGAVNADRR